MDRRTGRISGMDKAVESINETTMNFMTILHTFYPQLIDFSKESLDNIDPEISRIQCKHQSSRSTMVSEFT